MMKNPYSDRKILILGCISASLVFIIGTIMTRRTRQIYVDPPIELLLDHPIRRLPEKFPSKTHLPERNEGTVSGSIDLPTFAPDRDLTSVDDQRVWWESDNDDESDDEDDHIVHRSLEQPLLRLIELVCQEGGTLEVHDAYRATGIHNTKSLHKEGRAVDVTCDDFPLEKLAKLCWAAGFDWVYYEVNGGAHVHCSVRRNHDEAEIFRRATQKNR